jgi:hypothetical protein
LSASPGPRRTRDPRSGNFFRHHVHEYMLQKAMKNEICGVGIQKLARFIQTKVELPGCRIILNSGMLICFTHLDKELRLPVLLSLHSFFPVVPDRRQSCMTGT